MDHYIKNNQSRGAVVINLSLHDSEGINFYFNLMMRMKFTGKFSRGVLY